MKQVLLKTTELHRLGAGKFIERDENTAEKLILGKHCTKATEKEAKDYNDKAERLKKAIKEKTKETKKTGDLVSSETLQILSGLIEKSTTVLSDLNTAIEKAEVKLSDLNTAIEKAELLAEQEKK